MIFIMGSIKCKNDQMGQGEVNNMVCTVFDFE